ncbi:HK97-gp10 family putative phage morphogenesis protein [Arsukibacterium sp.]|uniref:HK97-gp10 family putative phage morphogenesis protein n=1 Tax=Arsukibacterium sp. TaxID=1977258 RepID=UPI00299E5AD6|nr:HK97-gp10 family putative phage morphogenesis protein [Arsukibacterium sp.]MDX1538829.1 HK97 gp10 family phage protein [Arsukibacterium sp.]
MSIKVTGLKELQAGLTQLGGKFARDAARKALSDAVKVPQKAMKQALPTKTGTARRSIRVRTRIDGNGVPVAYVGSFDKKAWYIRLLERGTKPTKTNVFFTRKAAKRSGKPKIMKIGSRYATARNHPGLTAGKYLENAFENNIEATLTQLKKRLREQIVVQTFKKIKSS